MTPPLAPQALFLRPPAGSPLRSAPRPIGPKKARQNTALRVSRLSAVLAVLSTLFLVACSPPPQLSIGSAASLRAVLPELMEAASDGQDISPSISYAASGVLRRQVEAGAPIDVFLSASAEEVDALIREGRATAGSRTVLASNQLVLVAHRAEASPLRFDTLGELPADQLLAIGNPDFVPAGRSGRSALEQRKLWAELQDRLLLASDVTAALAYARRREVAAAIVYATDVLGAPDVEVLDRAAWEGAPAPLVVGVVTQHGSEAPRAAELLAFLEGPEAAAIFRAHGFSRAGAGR